jgi:lactoylglutathione lyase
MKYAYTILYVESITDTIEFYEKAFGFIRKFITPENDYGELISGETTIAFASIELGNSNFKQGFEHTSKNGKPFGVELAFTTENIEADFQKAIESGATEFEPLTEKPWGQKVGYVLDNNGFLIEICTPIKTEASN